MNDFQISCLKAHNEYRARHGVPALELNQQMCAYAQEWADHLAQTEMMKHRQSNKYGENIYMKWSSGPVTVNGKEPVDSWYSEIKQHTFGTEPKSLGTGHFTQVVWKSCKSLGVGFAASRSGRIYVVANYDPPGNYVGQYRLNVLSPKA